MLLEKTQIVLKGSKPCCIDSFESLDSTMEVEDKDVFKCQDCDTVWRYKRNYNIWKTYAVDNR